VGAEDGLGDHHTRERVRGPDSDPESRDRKECVGTTGHSRTRPTSVPLPEHGRRKTGWAAVDGG
jgi:hypothetical protein